MSDYALMPSTVIRSQIIGPSVAPSDFDLITLIEHDKYGNNDPKLLDLHASSLIHTDKFNEHMHTKVEYKRYIRALERLNKECVNTIACVKVRLYIMRRKDPVIYQYALRKRHTWPTEPTATEPVTDLSVPAFDHKHFLRYVYKYTIEDAMNIINANNELFNTPYAEFMIYMYLGLKPTIDINPKIILAIICRVKKEFIIKRLGTPTIPTLIKYIDIPDDEFNVKKFAKEILLNCGDFTDGVVRLAKSYFTYLELINLGMASMDPGDVMLKSLHNDM
jgi:hypothetical protein